jgi:multiple sugar transport system substrate-binding protein
MGSTGARTARAVCLSLLPLLVVGTAVAQYSCSDQANGAQIDYWNGFSGPDGQFMADLVTRFNSENDQNVTVEMTIQPFTEYYNTLNAAAASNSLPDVLQIHLDQLATNATRGVIRPIPAELLGGMGAEESDFPEAAWRGTEVDGERFAIPLDVHPLVMWYNTEHWEAAGIENPAGRILERAEYEAALDALQQSNGEAVEWSVTTGFPIGWMFETLLYQFGGSRFNEDATEATFNSEAGVQALEYLRDMQSRYSRPNLPVDAGITAFKQGNSSTEWNGPWQVSNLTGEGYRQGWGAPLPNIGGDYAVTAGAHTLALARHRGREDAAKTAAGVCLIDFISEHSFDWVKDAGHIPARNSVRESEEFKALEPHASYAQMAEYVVFPPIVPGITDALAPLGQAVEAVLTGDEMDIEAALNDAANRANQILEQNRRRYGQR